MASQILSLPPSIVPAGTTSTQFTMPATADNEIVIAFTVQSPDVSDTTKTLSCQLIDVTNNNALVAGISGWQGGRLNKAGQPAQPAFGVTGLQSLVGHTLKFVLTLSSSLNTGITVTTG